MSRGRGPQITLGEALDHPVTRLVLGGFRALLGVIVVLAAFIGTSYVGDIKSTIEQLAVQLGEMDGRVDALERESAIRSALYEEDRQAYQRALEAHKKRQAAKATADGPPSP